MRRAQFATALNFRLGLVGFHSPLSRELVDSVCPRCGSYIKDEEELSRHLATCPETAPFAGTGDTSLKRRHERAADHLRRLESLGGIEVRKEPSFPGSQSLDRCRADWVAAGDSGEEGGPGTDCQKYVDVTISSPREAEQWTLERAERNKTLKYTSELLEGERFVPYAISPYGAFGNAMREGVEGSARRAARYLTTTSMAGARRSCSTERAGLEEDIRQEFTTKVATAVTEDTVAILHKVMDSLIGELQEPLGVGRPVARTWFPGPERIRRYKRGLIHL